MVENLLLLSYDIIIVALTQFPPKADKVRQYPTLFIHAEVAQWQSNGIVNHRLEVQFLSSAQINVFKNLGYLKHIYT